MSSEVGSGTVAIFPTFKGFRGGVSKETATAAKGASGVFAKVFAKTGAQSGKIAGAGFKGAFTDATKNVTSATVAKIKADVASTAKATSAARLKEQDAAGKLRVAETQLAEVRAKYTAGSSQLVRAEERVAAAQRGVTSAQESTWTSSTRLTEAQERLKSATERAASSTAHASSVFRGFGSSGVRAFGGVTTAAGGLGKVLIGGIGFGAATLAVGAFSRAASSAVGVISGSITEASNLQQSIGGVQAVFKSSSGVIDGWSRGAAKSVGLSQNAFNSFAAVIGSQLKGAGVPMAQLAGKTNQLIKLGSDLSATYGGTTADAVDALGAALRGEFDPLERFGVSLNQNAINARGLKLGFDLVNGSLTTQGKQAATLSLIYGRTKDAQGQFGKQTNTLAEQQQILAAQTDNLKAKFGTALLPAVSAVVGAFSKSLTPVMKGLQPVFDGIGRGAAALAPKLAQGIPGAIKAVSSVFRELVDIGKTVGPSIQSAFKMIGPVVTDAFKGQGPVLKEVIPQLASAAKDIIPALVTTLKDLAPALPPIAKGIALIAPAIGDAAKSVGGLVHVFTLVTKGSADMGTVADSAKGKFGLMAQVITGIAAPIGASIGVAIGTVRRFLSATRAVATGVGGFVRDAIAFFGRLASGVGAAIGKAVAIVRGLPGRAVTALGNVGSKLFNSGAKLIGGFVKGIRSVIGDIQKAVSDAMKAAGKFLPSSPAKQGVFSGRGWTPYRGEALAVGFAQGIVRGTPRIRSAANSATVAAQISPTSATAARVARLATSAANSVTSLRSSSTSPAASHVTVELHNKTGINLVDFIDVRVTNGIERQNDALNTAQRMGSRRVVTR